MPVPHTFLAGTSAVAADVNENFEDLDDRIVLLDTEKADVGHGHAQSDITGLAASLAALQPISAKDQANGYVGLNSSSEINPSFIPQSGGIYRGTWAASTAYKTHQIVLYQGKLYSALSNFTSDVTFNAANWAEMVPTAIGLGDRSTSQTLALADAGQRLQSTSTTGMTFRIPANATVAFPVGTVVEFARRGTGEVGIAGAAGVTVNSPDGYLLLNKQFSIASAVKVATDEWDVVGDLKSLRIVDLFTSDNGTNIALQSHLSDVGGPGSVGSWERSLLRTSTLNILAASGWVYNGNGSGNFAYSHLASPPSADYAVEADMVVVSQRTSDDFSICARYDLATDTGYFARWGAVNTRWELYKVVNATATLLGSSVDTAPAISATYTLRLEVTATRKTVYVNGVAVINDTTDNTIATVGKVAVRGSNASSSNGHHPTRLTMVPIA